VRRRRARRRPRSTRHVGQFVAPVRDSLEGSVRDAEVPLRRRLDRAELQQRRQRCHDASAERDTRPRQRSSGGCSPDRRAEDVDHPEVEGDLRYLVEHPARWSSYPSPEAATDGLNAV